MTRSPERPTVATLPPSRQAPGRDSADTSHQPHVFTKKHMLVTVDRPIVSGEEPQ